mgnify:CR=1 FL=1
MGRDINDVEDNLKLAIKEKLPIIITECAATDGSGDGHLYLDFFKKWVDYIDSNGISWIVWQFSDKKENSSLIMSKELRHLQWISEGTYTKKEIEKKEYNVNDYLSESGEIVKELIRKYSQEHQKGEK